MQQRSNGRVQNGSVTGHHLWKDASQRLPGDRVQLYGHVPVIDEATYLSPEVENDLKMAIGQLWNRSLSGASAWLVAVQGETGIGKSTLISHVLHDRSFVASLQDLEAIFWLHSCRLFSEDLFLMELGDVVKQHIPVISTTSVAAFASHLGADKKFLVVVDGVQCSDVASIVAQFYQSTRSILVTNRGASPLSCAHIDVISLPASDNLKFMSRLCCKLFNSKLAENGQLTRLVAASRGLPLVARIASKCLDRHGFDGLHVHMAQKELSHLAVMNHRPANVLRFALRSLTRKDHLRYYSLVLFEAGHPFSLQLLAWLWAKNDLEEARRVAQRFEQLGLVQRVQSECYSMCGYLHEAACQDAIQHGVAHSIEELRLRIIRGKLMESKYVPMNRMQKFLFKSGAAENILQLAVRSEDWPLLDVIVDHCNYLLMNKLCLCDDQMSNLSTHLLETFYKKCARNRRCQEAFLKVADGRVAPRQLDIVRFLARSKLCAAERLRDGETALMAASKYGESDVARFLVVDGKADVGESDADGFSALIVAAKFGHLKVVEFLHGKIGASLTQRDASGMSAMDWAARFGHSRIVGYLCDHLDLAHRDAAALAAFFTAAQRGHLEVVRLLHLQQCIDVNVRNDDGQTALQCALTNSPFCDGFRNVERQQVADYLLLCDSEENYLEEDGVI